MCFFATVLKPEIFGMFFFYFSGMIKNLADGDAELSASTMTFTLRRQKFVDFLPVLTTDSAAIFIRSANSEEFKFTTFVNVFTSNLWMAIFMSSLIIGTLLWIPKRKSAPKSFGQTGDSNYLVWNLSNEFSFMTIEIESSYYNFVF